MSSLRDHLRQSTAPAHAALESTPLVQSLAEGRQTAAEYRRYLQAQIALVAPIEAALRPWLGAGSAPRLSKTAWLRSDLAALGLDHRAAAGENPPDIDVRSRAQALGVAYVVEGNMLGLQMLRRRLPDAHPARHGAGRYFAGYGEQAGRQWQAFVAELDAVAPADWPQALAGAQQAFARFHEAYSDCISLGALCER